MDFIDIMNYIISFIIGIASGAISSVLVTILYRKVDSNRERDLMFASANLFISRFLVLDCENIENVYEFLRCNTPPKVYNWSPLKKDEKRLFIKLYNLVFELRRDLSTYHTDNFIKKMDPSYKPSKPALDYKSSILSTQSDLYPIKQTLTSLENTVITYI